MIRQIQPLTTAFGILIIQLVEVYGRGVVTRSTHNRY